MSADRRGNAGWRIPCRTGTRCAPPEPRKIELWDEVAPHRPHQAGDPPLSHRAGRRSRPRARTRLAEAGRDRDCFLLPIDRASMIRSNHPGVGNSRTHRPASGSRTVEGASRRVLTPCFQDGGANADPTEHPCSSSGACLGGHGRGGSLSWLGEPGPGGRSQGGHGRGFHGHLVTSLPGRPVRV